MSPRFALFAAGLLAACAETKTSHRFVRTDVDFHPAERERARVAYGEFEIAPEHPLRFVGVLEFQMPYTARSETVEQFVDRVAKLGGSFGCDVLFQRDFFQGGWRYQPISWGKQTPQKLWLRESSRTWQFLCGVEGATPAEQWRTIRDASIVAVAMRDQVLGPVCERRTPPLGSHVVRQNICGDER